MKNMLFEKKKKDMCSTVGVTYALSAECIALYYTIYKYNVNLFSLLYAADHNC